MFRKPACFRLLPLWIPLLPPHRPEPICSGIPVHECHPGTGYGNPESERGSDAMACPDQTRTCPLPDHELRLFSVGHPRATSHNKLFDSYHSDRTAGRHNYNIVSPGNPNATKRNANVQQETKCSNVMGVTYQRQKVSLCVDT